MPSQSNTSLMNGDELDLLLATRLYEAGAGADAFAVIPARLVLDVYDKVHPAYLGHVELSGGSAYGDTPERVKTTREVCDELYEKAVAAGWVSGSTSCNDRTMGQVLLMHSAELSTFSIRSRQRLMDAGLGWRVETGAKNDGSYTITSRPDGGRAVWAFVEDDERTEFVMRHIEDQAWLFRSADRPADDDYRICKLVALLVAAYEGGARGTHLYVMDVIGERVAGPA